MKSAIIQHLFLADIRLIFNINIGLGQPYFKFSDYDITLSSLGLFAQNSGFKRTMIIIPLCVLISVIPLL